MTQSQYPPQGPYPVAGPPPPDFEPSQSKTKRFGWPTVLITAVGSWFIGLIMGLMGGEPVSTAAPEPSVITTTATAPAEDQQPSQAQTTKAPAPPAPKPTKKAAPELTKAQEQAIGSAKEYLDYGHFSRKGLIDQLKYEKYSTKVATFAVDYLKINWNKQAAGSAKEYLDYSHFSRSGLIDQLEYEGYTHSQAAYGVKKAGL